MSGAVKAKPAFAAAGVLVAVAGCVSRTSRARAPTGAGAEARLGCHDVHGAGSRQPWENPRWWVWPVGIDDPSAATGPAAAGAFHAGA